MVSQLAKPLWLRAATEGSAPALPCCGSRLLCSQLHQHTVLSSHTICICSGKGLTQQLSGGDKALYKLRISNINISHGFVEFWRDAGKRQTSHKKRRLFLLMLGRSVFAGGIDLVSQDSFVFVCVSLRSEILHHWGKCRLWSEWLKSEHWVYLNQLTHGNCQF